MHAIRRFQTLAVLAVLCCTQGLASAKTALDDYVEKPDASYGFELESTRNKEGYTVFVIQMTSQTWRTPAEVDRTLWEHEVLVAVPWATHSGNQNTAMLIVNGGTNSAPPTEDNDQLLGTLAIATGSIAAMISQVPNQRLAFTDEDETRIEDELLAYGMDKYLVTGDPEWLIQLPMTKAVVRAMDTVQQFAREADFAFPTVPRVDDFVVLGGSKRGWATWLTAAVEARKGAASRVRAIVPVSIDLLNMDEQFIHHWNAYGFYAPSVHDYADLDIPCRSLSPAGQAMLQIIDPHEYRDRLTMPKLVLNSAGDQFFLPDSSQFYFDQLPEPKQLRYTFNTDHSQAQDLGSIVPATVAWLSEVLDDARPPQFSWTLEPNGAIRVQAADEPERVRLWHATNPDARDFRLETLGPAWTSMELTQTASGEYVGYRAPPPQGWTAFGVELSFAGSTLIPTPLESDQIYTTPVRVTPSDLPFRDADGPCGRYAPPVWAPASTARADHRWTFVGAPAFYADPVVIAGPPSASGADPGVVRLRDVGDLGFELRFQEWDYRDGWHPAEDIPYVLLEAGRHVMGDGSVWEAGSFELGGTGTWSSVGFAAGFPRAPHLFLTMQSANGAQAASVRARNVTASGFEAAMFEQESLMDGHVIETIGYLAIHSPAGGGLLDLNTAQVPYLLQTLTADHRWTPVLSQRLRLEEEQSRDPETDHVEETLHVLALGNQFFAQQVTHRGADPTALRRLPPTAAAPMEWGLIRGIDHNWQMLPFAKTYDDPILIAKPASSHGADPGVIRLGDVQADMARLRYQEWPYLDGSHTREDVFYLVSEAGRHGLGGLAVEAGRLRTDKLSRAGLWENVAFRQPFAQHPVLLASVTSDNGWDTVTSRIRALDATGFQIAMDEQESNTDGHVNETLGWVAVQPGNARTGDGRALDVFFTSVDDRHTAIPFTVPTQHRHPSVIADIVSTYGSDPVVLRYADPTGTAILLKLAEEQSRDDETAHVREDIGVFAAE
ncbi:MAG: PhoPQ-activated pathogenicity-related family protein [Thiohalocapsa sp.]|nr:PhoPQ-activated pathogenicity-related family protein [Thiohalocapsa sp.]